MKIKKLKFIKTKEAANLLNYSSQLTIRRKISKKIINAILINNEYRIDTREINRLLNHSQQTPVKVEYNTEIDNIPLTSVDIANILSINKIIAGKYIREWTKTDAYSNLRITQNLFLEKLKEMQTISLKRD